MENVVLTIHLILALLLIVIVLLQRSEGGGLGMGGGGGGAVSGRSAATALGKITWGLATGFIITSITLTILAANSSNGRSVIDQLGGTVPAAVAPALPALEGDLLPPSATDAPAAPPAAPATPPAAPAN
jgi:preprotein translocase subunit SecG